MRLYKPGLHSVPTYIQSVPAATKGALSSSSASSREAEHLSDFALSPFLLLPDSFGDIYLGEEFSAYVAVVNGMQDGPFHNVSLTLRLLATNATHDLLDVRGSSDSSGGNSSTASSAPLSAQDGASPQKDGGRTLESNAFTDTVVKHRLTELGTHTLRVSVQYTSHRSGELKTLRKFYRFNVLQPLLISSSCTELGGQTHESSSRLVVQCHVTNSTQSPIFLQEVRFNAAAPADTVEPISAPTGQGQGQGQGSLFAGLGAEFNPESWPLLLPGESYAQAFIVVKPAGWRQNTSPAAVQRDPVGQPLVTWSSFMAESGAVTGEVVFVTPPPSMQQQQQKAGRADGASTPPPQSNPAGAVDGRRRGSSTVSSASQQQQLPLQRIQIIAVDCPSAVIRGREFSVALRCRNCTPQPVLLYLQSSAGDPGALPNLASASGATYNANRNGLCVTGLSGASVGVLQPGESVLAAVTVFPLACGLFDLACLAAVDKHSGAVYHGGSLGKVLVRAPE